MAGTYAHLRVFPYEAWFNAVQGESVKKLTEEILLDCIVGCPIDHGDLVESLGTRYPGGKRGIIKVGTDHWAETEYGSRPHVIRSHGKWSLRSDEGEYFGRTVHHPGTPAQPFMRPALYQRRRV